GLSRHQADRGLAKLGLADLQVGQKPGRRRRLRSQRLGPGADRAEGPDREPVAQLRPAQDERHRRQRVPGGRRAWPVRFHFDGRYAVVWELNMWYHTLNCGYRCRISGETDFPCIYGERVGLGRSYVHLDGKLDFDAWAEGIKRGRCYVSDGKSHLMDFTVNGHGVGVKDSEVQLAEPGEVEIKAKVAALLEPKPTPATERIRKTPLDKKPYWDIERARLNDTRTVPVEVVVNGQPVARKEIIADGTEQEVTFRVPIKASSWVCLRIFPSSHTNPLFVLVGDKPIRASKRSVEWCLQSVDKCWQQKKRAIRKEEQPAAEKAYEQARTAYKKILAETTRD